MSSANSVNSIHILFENEHWVVVDKPAGYLTVPGHPLGGGRIDSRPCLGIQLSEQLNVRLWPVHRLDLEVSGIVLFAKDSESHRVACKWFEEHLVAKTYEALTAVQPHVTEGQAIEIPRGEQRWILQLAKGKKRAFESAQGKEAITIAECRGAEPALHWGLKSALRWHLQPLTGRSHQLRVSLFKFWGPIVGDFLYGWPEGESTQAMAVKPTAQMALRAVTLDFTKIAPDARGGLPVVLMNSIISHSFCLTGAG